MSVADTALEMARDHAEDHGRTGSAQREREESLSVVTSSCAAVATAWAAFEAAVWSSKQTFLLAGAVKQRSLATEARLEGNQQLQVDAELFVAWAAAHSEHNAELSQFLYDRFPPRLKVAMDAWLATKPLESSDAPPQPFKMPQYQLEPHQRSVVLGKAADHDVELGHDANFTADTYVLATVFLAMIILLASLSMRLRSRAPRRVMLAMSGFGLLAAMAWLAMRPIAWPGD
jgi:hypothetical protein